jgi:hypothetical protein
MISYSKRRCSSLSLLEELHVLHSTYFLWKHISLSSHFHENDLYNVGYCLFWCDVMKSGGNLQMNWRNVHKISNTSAKYFLVYTLNFKHLKLFLIRPFSNYNDNVIWHIRHSSFIPHFFYFSSFWASNTDFGGEFKMRTVGRRNTHRHIKSCHKFRPKQILWIYH